MNRHDYEWDVFLSYRRNDEWPQWVRDHLVPLLRHWLTEYLDPPGPRVFVDEAAIELGRDWPNELAQAHARSAVLVPLLSRNYFSSVWCTVELSLMYQREKACGYRTPSCSDVLIVPGIVHDGEYFPPAVQRMQSKDLKDFVSMRMDPTGTTAERLEVAIKQWVPSIAKAIEAAPPIDDAWLGMATGDFENVFEQGPPGQPTVPKLTGP